MKRMMDMSVRELGKWKSVMEIRKEEMEEKILLMEEVLELEREVRELENRMEELEEVEGLFVEVDE